MSTAEHLADTRFPGGRLGASSFKSVVDMWHHRVRSTPDGEAMFFKRDGAWVPMTWSEAGERSRLVANGLLANGLEKEQRCCIVSETCTDWVLVDMAILCAGGATTTVYPSSTPEECEFIVDDCGARFAFCDTQRQVDKLLAARDRLRTLRGIIVFDGAPTEDGFVRTLAQLEEEGRRFAAENPARYDEVASSVGPDDLATLMYTSGTTGLPKGVMLTHDAWIYEGEAIDSMGIMTPADKQFLFLPLSHVFAKVLQVIFIRLGVPTAIDGDVNALVQNLGETHPTWMGAVPRIFEKAYAKVVSGAKEGGAAKWAVFQWALGVGREVSKLRQQKREPSGLLRLRYALADRLVFSKVKERFGGRLRFFISGGAPLPKEIAEFFHACDILILEGYGLTESAAASCVNHPEDFVFGTVGKPVPGCEVRIEDDGEIHLRSRGVMKGYYNLPDDTREALTEDGWLRTGDIGLVLDSGHVKITDRKKDLIITAGGKNIAPAHFQNLLKARSLFVANVLMHGDKRPYCTALVSINEETVEKWAQEQGLAYTSYADLAGRPEVHALVQRDVDAVNAGLPSYETVKKIALVPEDMTVENGLLTPSMKVKRKVVEARYQDLIDAMYAPKAES